MSKKLLSLLVVAGCAHSGMSESVRNDITMKMESVRPTLTDCYAKELKFDRKLNGVIVVAFTAAPSTGKFEGVEVVRDDIKDPALTRCVTEAVGGLALSAPQKTKVSVTYPLDFAPTK